MALTQKSVDCRIGIGMVQTAVRIFSGVFRPRVSNRHRVSDCDSVGFVTACHIKSSVYVRDTPRGGGRRWWMAEAGGTLTPT